MQIVPLKQTQSNVSRQRARALEEIETKPFHSDFPQQNQLRSTAIKQKRKRRETDDSELEKIKEEEEIYFQEIPQRRTQKG